MKSLNNKKKFVEINDPKTGFWALLNLKKGSLRIRIIRGFLAIAIALIVLGLLNFKSLSNMEDKFNFVVEHDAVVIENARQLEKLVVDMETGQRGYIITGNDKFLEPYYLGIKNFDILYEEQINLVSDNPSQIKNLQHIKKLVEEWKINAAVSEIKQSLESGKELPVKDIFNMAEGKNRLDEIRMNFSQFIQIELDLTDMRHEAATNISIRTKYISILIIFLGGFGALIIGITLSNSISKPILKLKDAALEIAKGILDNEVKVARNDEVGQLGEQMEIMRINLLKTLSELKDYRYAIDETAIVAITDENGIITYANKQFSDISKYPIDELVGQNHRILNSGHHPTEFFKNMWTTIYKGEMFNADIKNKAKDGSFYWINTTLVPFLDRKGKPFQYMAVSRDITDSKMFNITLENLVEKLKLSKENQSQFLSNMSHEIRTPMNGILGMTRLLQKTKLEKEQVKYTDAIFTSASNLMVIINEILDFSKIEAGKLTIEQVNFNLFEEIFAWKETLKISAKDKKVDLEFNLNKDVPQFLIGDPVRLTQIIYNLCSNAIKFTEKGGSVTVNFSIEKTIENSVHLHVDVKDDGIGIHKDKLGSIFLSFSQASSSTTRKFGGTGLGLTITKQLVELQNGEIRVESEEGKGSTFSFTIPYLIGSKEIHQEPIKKEIQPSKINKDIKVLLVEDHDINQLLATTVLEEWNFTVDIAENGLEAVEKVKNNSYNIILMDIHMPLMDGYLATTEIRNTIKDNTPIIALTASARITDNQRCYDVGMNDFIAKPFDPNELLEKITKNITKHIEE